MSGTPNPSEEFLAEATEILEAWGRDLLVLDRERGARADPARINAMFRAAHSLKGLAGLFGQDLVGHLAHRSEDLLDRLRLGKVSLSDDALDALIECVEELGRLLAESARGAITPESTERASRMADRLDGIAVERRKRKRDPLERLALDPAVRGVLTEYEEARIRDNLRRGASFMKIRVSFPLADFDRRLAELTERLKPFGELLSTLPSSEGSDGERIAFELLFAGTGALDGLADAVSEDSGKISEVPVRKRPAKRPHPSKAREAASRQSGPEPEPEPAAEPDPESNVAPLPRREEPADASSLRSLTQTVRVDIRKLDSLMNSVGELIRIRSNLEGLAEQVRSSPSDGVAGREGPLPSRGFASELSREMRALERKLEELQRGLLEARMVPLTQVFEKLSRLVRRIARESDKEIAFVTSGGEVELDKLIIEELSDPLMHILRNAIDHGIEHPAARVRAGKPRKGEIRLVAAHRGAHVEIAVVDDGAGIDLERVRRTAVGKGLITADEATSATPRELLNLLFTPGFSTAPAVSQLSGRGVGLDVVKTNIGHLSGIIDVASTKGAGTTFTLTLPITLAILRALIIGTSGRTYALPLNSVLEILSVRPDEIRTIERREVVDMRGQTLPLVRLARLFELPERPVERHFVVVVGLAQERLGIAVDSLHGQQDIVTKPLGARLGEVPGISGATELGNRRTVLVLDVGALMEEIFRPREQALARIG